MHIVMGVAVEVLDTFQAATLQRRARRILWVPMEESEEESKDEDKED